MKNTKTTRVLSSTITILILGLLTVSFGSKKGYKPTTNAKKSVANIATKCKDTVSKSSSIKSDSLEPKEDLTNELSDNDDIYATACWIGSVPKSLADSINTDGLVFIDSTAFGKKPHFNVQELYINADGVPNIKQFVNSPFFQSFVENKNSVFIYNDKTSRKDEQLLFELVGLSSEGTSTDSIDFTMISYIENGHSISLVGNRQGWYNPKRLSIFQVSNLEEISFNNQQNPNARNARLIAGQFPYRYNIHAVNRLPKTIEKSFIMYKGKKVTVWLGAPERLSEKHFRIYRKERVYLTKRLSSGQFTVYITAGSGKVLINEGERTSYTGSVEKSWDWSESTALSSTSKFDFFGVGYSFSQSLGYKKGEGNSSGYSQSVETSSNGTWYVYRCDVACCDVEAGIWALQQYKVVKVMSIGNAYVTYQRYALSPIAAYQKRWANNKDLNIPLRFNYNSSTPFYSKYKKSSELFISTIITRVDRTCKKKDCNAYKFQGCY